MAPERCGSTLSIEGWPEANKRRDGVVLCKTLSNRRRLPPRISNFRPPAFSRRLQPLSFNSPVICARHPRCAAYAEDRLCCDSAGNFSRVTAEIAPPSSLLRIRSIGFVSSAPIFSSVAQLVLSYVARHMRSSFALARDEVGVFSRWGAWCLGIAMVTERWEDRMGRLGLCNIKLDAWDCRLGCELPHQARNRKPPQRGAPFCWQAAGPTHPSQPRDWPMLWTSPALSEMTRMGF